MRLTVGAAMAGARITPFRRAKLAVFFDGVTGLVRFGGRLGSYSEKENYMGLQVLGGINIYPWRHVGFGVATGYRRVFDTNTDQFRAIAGLALRH